MALAAGGPAFKDGHLEISFTEGGHLAVPADEGFEAWEFVGPQGVRALCLPGGELALWSPPEDCS